ncbi:MAG TPA: adenylosuccinate lyase [Candidatus Andersenbacteria bacterium]|nr:adenylosuccinate lyase [Candidatus Andersenbacteria bacterium]
MSHDSYVSPLSGRYSSQEMKRIWSDDTKFQTWRRLWIRLAEAQQQLGLAISGEQITQMQENVANIDYDLAQQLERKLRHDVVAHIHAFGEVAPLAKPIIHLGATSCYVTDNTDIMQMRDGLRLLCVRLARVIARLRDFAFEHRALPTLGYTHFQAASLTTVGKRAAIWLQDLLMDLQVLERVRDGLQFLGVKGATGTQDSFLELFQGEATKVLELDRLVTAACVFSQCFSISGQTYTRKQDTQVIAALADFGATVHKIGNDLRLLQHKKEVEEPFEASQVGSSAMPYKRNPMRAERACSLSRELMACVHNAYQTHALQWFERTLDDSAGRRRFIPEAFLLADSIALILQNVMEGLVVYPAVITRHIAAELPFMATEKILMAMVATGGDRQEAHEKIRQHAQAAGNRVKQEGADNDLMERLAQDPYFEPVHGRLAQLLDPIGFIGLAPLQVDTFVSEVDQALLPYRDQLTEQSELTV